MAFETSWLWPVAALKNLSVPMRTGVTEHLKRSLTHADESHSYLFAVASRRRNVRGSDDGYSRPPESQPLLSEIRGRFPDS